MAARGKKSKPSSPRRAKSVDAKCLIFLILGEDTYLRDLHREELIAKYLAPGERELGLIRVDLSETSLGEALGRAATPALFVQGQVLLITRLDRIRDDDVKSLESYLASPPEHALLIFESPKLDRRTKAAKLLLESGELRDAGRTDDDGVALEAVGKFAAEMNLEVSSDAAQDLVFAVGTDLGLLRREVEKLAVYSAETGKVEARDVGAVVQQARQFEVFDMADCLAGGERAAALMRLRNMLARGESPVGVVGALAYIFRQLMRARGLSPDAAPWEAARSLKMRGPRAEALVRQAHRFSRADLRRALGLLLEADVALKSSAPDPAALLEALVVNLSRVEGAGALRRA